MLYVVFIRLEGFISWHNNANAPSYNLFLLGQKMEMVIGNM
jgi:hypothetical protein